MTALSRISVCERDFDGRCDLLDRMNGVSELWGVLKKKSVGFISIIGRLWPHRRSVLIPLCTCIVFGIIISTVIWIFILGGKQALCIVWILSTCLEMQLDHPL